MTADVDAAMNTGYHAKRQECIPLKVTIAHAVVFWKRKIVKMVK